MNYFTYLQSDDWVEVRRTHKKKRCEICGAVAYLHLHHLDYKNLGKETEEDVATLCDSCHHASHIGLVSTAKLRKPSAATRRIVNRLRLGRGLKREQLALFLRRKWIAKFGEKNVPPFEKFRKMAKRGSKYKKKGYGFPIQSWFDSCATWENKL